MNITLQLQELDDLIIKHTAPPVTAILRNKLHPLREQMEAYIEAQEKKAREHAKLAAEHPDLQQAQANLQTSQSPELADMSAEKVEYLRGLYFEPGDSIPFCPHCWETSNGNQTIHLSGPMPMMDKRIERWECHACDNDYTAKLGEKFRPCLSTRRRRAK